MSSDASIPAAGERRHSLGLAARLGIVFVAYLATAEWWLLLDGPQAVLTLLRPTTGVALACLILLGRQVWPAVACAAFTATLLTGPSAETAVAAIGIAAGNTIEAYIGAYLLQRIGGFNPALTRLRDVAALTIIGAGFGSLIGATIGVAALLLRSHLTMQIAHRVWVEWWMGGAMSSVVVAPALLTAATTWRGRTLTRSSLPAVVRRTCELLAFVAILAAIVWVEFGPDTRADRSVRPLAYPVMPLLVWSAIRFGPLGASWTILLIAVIAAWSTSLGHGPFATPDDMLALSHVWVFSCAMAVTGLLLGAAVSHLTKTEAALEASEQRFKALAMASPVGIYRTDALGRTVYSNDRWYEIAGFVSPRDRGRGWKSALHPGDRDRVVREWETAVARAETFQSVYRYQRRDGGATWVVGLAMPERNARGEVVGFVGTTTDITERVKAEESLRLSEQQLRLHFSQTAVAVIEWNMDFTVREWNAAAERIFGYSRSEALGRHAIDLLVPEAARPHVNQIWADLVSNRGGTRNRNENITRDGRTILCEWFNTPLIDDADRVIGVASMAYDITERQAAEDALRASDERLRSVITGAPVVLWAMDAMGVVTLSEGTGLAALGLKPGEVVGRSVFELYPDHPTINSDHRRALAGESLATVVEVAGLVFESRLTPIRGTDGDVTGVIGVATDITDRMSAEKALRESSRILQLMFSELDHRVRNNLASLEALIDITARDRATVREFAASIKGRVQAMSSVHTLLSSGHWVAVSLRQLIHAMIPTSVAAACTLEGPEVMVNPRQVTALGMILQELTANSMKYGSLSTPKGRVHVSWSERGGDQSRGTLSLTWLERGGPPVVRSPVAGQGTHLIEGLLGAELAGEGEFRYPREGATHTLRMRLES